MSVSAAPARVKPGMTFRSVIADASCLFEVKEPGSRGWWRCEVIPEPEPITVGDFEFFGDYIGTEQMFKSSDILRRVRGAMMFADAANRAQAAKEKLQPGMVVHVSAFPGQWVRGQIVTVDGETMFQPQALVGDWSERQRTGVVTDEADVCFAYDVQQVVDQEPHAFRPDSVVESAEYAYGDRDSGVDVAALPALELIFPQITDTDRRYADVLAVIDEARGLLTGDGSPDDRQQSKDDRIAAALRALDRISG